MARRQLTDEDELALIRDAEAARDSGPLGTPVRMTVSPQGTAVLSVRLPMEQMRDLRSVAESRHISVSALLQEAVAGLLAAPGPRMSASRKLSRLWVSGARPAEDDSNGLDVTITDGNDIRTA